MHWRIRCWSPWRAFLACGSSRSPLPPTNIQISYSIYKISVINKVLRCPRAPNDGPRSWHVVPRGLSPTTRPPNSTDGFRGFSASHVLSSSGAGGLAPAATLFPVCRWPASLACDSSRSSPPPLHCTKVHAWSHMRPPGLRCRRLRDSVTWLWSRWHTFLTCGSSRSFPVHPTNIQISCKVYKISILYKVFRCPRFSSRWPASLACTSSRSFPPPGSGVLTYPGSSFLTNPGSGFLINHGSGLLTNPGSGLLTSDALHMK